MGLYLVRVDHQGPLLLVNALGCDLTWITLLRWVQALETKIGKARQNIGVLVVFLQGRFEVGFYLSRGKLAGEKRKTWIRL